MSTSDWQKRLKVSSFVHFVTMIRVTVSGYIGLLEHIAEPVDDGEDDERQRKQFARQSVDIVSSSLLNGHKAMPQPEAEFAHWLGDRRKQL